MNGGKVKAEYGISCVQHIETLQGVCPGIITFVYYPNYMFKLSHSAVFQLMEGRHSLTAPQTAPHQRFSSGKNVACVRMVDGIRK